MPDNTINPILDIGDQKDKYAFLPLRNISTFLDFISMSSERVSDNVLKTFRNIGIELIDSVLTSSVQLSRLRDQPAELKSEDISLVFEKKHGIHIPPLAYIQTYTNQVNPMDESSIHQQRISQIKTQQYGGVHKYGK